MGRTYQKTHYSSVYKRSNVADMGVMIGDACFSGSLGSPLGAGSPSLCLSLTVGIRGKASLAWSSLSPDLSTRISGEQRERLGYQMVMNLGNDIERVSASFGNNPLPGG